MVALCRVHLPAAGLYQLPRYQLPLALAAATFALATTGAGMLSSGLRGIRPARQILPRRSRSKTRRLTDPKSQPRPAGQQPFPACRSRITSPRAPSQLLLNSASGIHRGRAGRFGKRSWRHRHHNPTHDVTNNPRKAAASQRWYHPSPTSSASGSHSKILQPTRRILCPASRRWTTSSASSLASVRAGPPSAVPLRRNNRNSIPPRFPCDNVCIA